MSRPTSQTALCAVACFLLAPAMLAGATAVRLSVPLDSSALVVRQMRAELGRITKPTGLTLDWVADGEAREGRRVSVRLVGRCTAVDGREPTRGPLGWTRVVDGRILPYIEVDCDRVRATISPEIERQEPTLREAALGRALARTLAHELRHALGRTSSHAEHGLGRERLGSRELLYGSFHLERADLEPLVEAARPDALRPQAPERAGAIADDVGPDAPLELGR